MTVREAITQVNNIKPSQYDEETMIRWLSDVDGLIYSEILSSHEGAESIPHGPYGLEGDQSDDLMVPEPYADLYVKYLMAQIDFANAEYDRYNNSMVMYNAALATYADWFNRKYMPKQENYVRI